ncbi:MAG: B12-binding domain-containing radical SAM protein [Eubacteriales bacterium]
MNTFCLVALNSQYVHTNLAVRLIKNTNIYNNTIVLEHTINNQMDLVLEDIISQNPKCIIFSCYIWNINYVYDLVSSIKKVLEDSIIVLAGPEVSYTYQDIISQNKNVDIVCFGTGEIIYPQLQRGIHENNLSSVEGICYRDGSEILTNPIASTYDINTQKFPYYDIADVRDRILYFETSRGCPFNCSYCISSIEKGVQLMESQKIRESFEVFFQHDAKQVKLVDRTFNYPVKRAIEIIKIMLELKQKYPNSQTSFHCELNPLLITQELADILSTAPYGFLQFEIGIQSTYPKTLQAIKRDVDLAKQYENITMLTKLENIKVYVDLIAGLPYETYEIFQNSFNDVYKMNAGGVHLGFLKVLKGSYMQSTAGEHGIAYQEYAPYKILKSDYISFAQLSYLEKIESLVDTYYNSGNFNSSLNYAISLFETPYDFYDSFCSFLMEREHFNRPHKFIYYYDVLFEFICKMKNCNSGFLQSVILHDYAANSKPRVYPQCIQNAYSEQKKDFMREFYGNPENIEKYLPNYAGMSPSTISRQCNIEIFSYDVLSKDIVAEETILLYDYMNKTKIHKII